MATWLETIAGLTEATERGVTVVVSETEGCHGDCCRA
jgi:hypothetical protein